MKNCESESRVDGRVPCVYKTRKKYGKIFSLISEIRFNWSSKRTSL